jgi:hypothetical protein
MSYFAKVVAFTDSKGIVEEVIRADQEFIDAGYDGDPNNWYQTSYNTRGGIYYLPDSNTPDQDQSKALRANYAGVGYTLDMSVVQNGTIGVFYAPQPYPSWTVSAPTWIWQPPVPYPNDGKAYYWDEATQSWVLVEPQP